MKKIFLSMLAFTMAAFTFTSCEDVPEPYEIPGNNGGGNTTVEGVYIDQDFSKSLGDFKSVGTNENISWGIDYSSACITGYKDYNGDGTKENQAGVTYLVSPEVDLTNSTEAYVSINHAINYEKADINANNSVLISKDYNGDVNTATWEALAYNTDGLGSSFTFVTKKVAIPAEYVNGKVYIALRHTCSASQSSTWEVKSVSVKEGTVEDETPETGDNSKEKPYTVAYAIANNSGNAWVKGYIVGWIEGQVLAEGAKFNGNSSVKTNILIADDANETDLSKCMPVQLPTGTVRNALNLQDNPNNYKQEVILYGSLEKYFGAAGLKSVSEYVLNNGGGNEEQPPVEEGTPSGDGTVDNPFNSVAANQLAASLGNGETTDNDYYIKGKVVSIKENFTTQYGNATFYISDNGKSDNQFYVFRALYLNNEKYTSGDVLSVGDEVVVCGKLTNYMGNTPETVQGQAYIYSWSKNSGGNTGDDDNPGGEVTDNSITVVASSFGLENGTEVGTQTLADGTVITFASGGNQNAPKYYNSGTNIRMYPKNSLTITSSKTIASVIINCDEYQGVICNASGDVKAEPGTVNTNDKVININGINSQQTVITNTSGTTGSASQIRMVSFTINYAK